MLGELELRCKYHRTAADLWVFECWWLHTCGCGYDLHSNCDNMHGEAISIQVTWKKISNCWTVLADQGTPPAGWPADENRKSALQKWFNTLYSIFSNAFYCYYVNFIFNFCTTRELVWGWKPLGASFHSYNHHIMLK